MNKVIDRDQRRVSARKVDRALRRLCTEHRITMVAIANHLDMDRANLYEKLNGNGPLELCEVERMAEAFNLTTAEFLEVADAPMLGKRAPTLKSRKITWNTLFPDIARVA